MFAARIQQLWWEKYLVLKLMLKAIEIYVQLLQVMYKKSDLLLEKPKVSHILEKIYVRN